MKKVLVACERSQVVTTAFRDAGAEAFSCDIEKCYGGHPEWHIKCDVREVMYDNWNLVIAHPPCTMLARVSAVAYEAAIHTMEDIEKARTFFLMFLELKCPVCVENPIPLKIARLPKWSQIVCPSQFGHPYTKKSCLWLKDLPPLLPMYGSWYNVRSWHDLAGGSKVKRSRFFEKIAEAMAAQWLPIVK